MPALWQRVTLETRDRIASSTGSSSVAPSSSRSMSPRVSSATTSSSIRSPRSLIAVASGASSGGTLASGSGAVRPRPIRSTALRNSSNGQR